MSAFGTKRTSACALQMSAFGGKADIAGFGQGTLCLLMTQQRHWAVSVGSQNRAIVQALPVQIL